MNPCLDARASLRKGWGLDPVFYFAALPFRLSTNPFLVTAAA